MTLTVRKVKLKVRTKPKTMDKARLSEFVEAKKDYHERYDTIWSEFKNCQAPRPGLTTRKVLDVKKMWSQKK